MEPVSAGALISTVGFPIAALIGVAFSAWKAANFLAPRVDQWFTRHFSLIDGLTDRLGKIDTLPTAIQSHGCRLPNDGIQDLVCRAEELDERVRRIEAKLDQDT